MPPLHKDPEFRNRWLAIAVWWGIIALVAACLVCVVSSDWERIDAAMWQGYSPEARAFDQTCPLYQSPQTPPPGAPASLPAEVAGPDAVPSPSPVPCDCPLSPEVTP